MAFFDKISKTGQGVVQKTKNTAEILKYNSMIADEKKRLIELYQQVGDAYCSLYADSCDEALRELVAAVNSIKALIAEYTDKINKLKGVETCPNCRTEIIPGAAFCSACGTKIEHAVSTPETSVPLCANCKKPLIEGSAFCVYCGTRVESTAAEVQDLYAEPISDNNLSHHTVYTDPASAEAEKTCSEPVTADSPQTLSPEVVPTGICQVCGSHVGNNLFCVVCGTKVEKAAAPAVTDVYESIPATTETYETAPVTDSVCVNCGTYVGDDLFCTKCGTRVTRETAPTYEAEGVPADVCVTCGAYVGDSNFCTKCGTKTAREIPQAVPTVKHCPNCGNEFPLDSRFCTLCGAELK